MSPGVDGLHQVVDRHIGEHFGDLRHLPVEDEAADIQHLVMQGMQQQQHEAGRMAHGKADVAEDHQPRFFPALAAQCHLEGDHVVAVILLDRLDDVEFAAILIVLHPPHVFAETQHHAGDHILHGGLLFRGRR